MFRTLSDYLAHGTIPDLKPNAKEAVDEFLNLSVYPMEVNSTERDKTLDMDDDDDDVEEVSCVEDFFIVSLHGMKKRILGLINKSIYIHRLDFGTLRAWYPVHP